MCMCVCVCVCVIGCLSACVCAYILSHFPSTPCGQSSHSRHALGKRRFWKQAEANASPPHALSERGMITHEIQPNRRLLEPQEITSLFSFYFSFFLQFSVSTTHRLLSISLSIPLSSSPLLPLSLSVPLSSS